MTADDDRLNFDHMASNYETVINRLVPYYAKQNSLMMDLIPFERKDVFRALDLGAATGILSRLLLDTFPNAEVTAFDSSAVMLDMCKKKLWAYPNRAILKQGDFLTDDLGGDYDAVFTGLLVQHTDDGGRRAFIKKVINRMRPGGILLSRDMVRGSSPRLTEEYDRLWKLFMRAQGEDGALWASKFHAKDPPSTAEDLMKWMNEAGFIDVGCHWRYLNFAILGCRKPR